MSKSIYLAGKLHADELQINDFAEELESRGHTVLEKWWLQPKLPTPYLSNKDTSAPAASAMIKAATQSDVTILFPSDAILGAAVEFGVALASADADRQKQIIVVNPLEVRQSVFYAHPAVIAVKGLAEIKGMAWY